MTVSNLYFRILLLLITSCFLAGCSVFNKSTLQFKSSFKGYSYKGVHTRAVTVQKGMALTAGMGGVVSFRFLNNKANNSDFIQGVEDFRDIHFNEMGACLLMNAGENGLIYAITPDGNKVKLFDTSGVFFNGMDFWGDDIGMVYGDPVKDHFFLAKTIDKGRNWVAFEPESMPKALVNEVGFAASGTGIQTIGESSVYFATSSPNKARLFCSYDRGYNWVVKETGMRSGESYGIYSIFFLSEKEGFVIGGSYKDTTYNKDICQYTTNGGKTWKNRSDGLLGYCSCIAGTPNGSLLVATGKMGTFYSLDKGKRWSVLTQTPYYSCLVTDKTIVLSGKNGALEFIEFERITK